MIKFKALPKILAGKRCNFEEMDGNFLQNIVFQSFCFIFRLEKDISRHKGSMEGACMFQGQIGKITSQTPWRLDNFLVLALFFHLSLPKIGLATPIKIICLKLSRIGLSFHKVWLS